MKKKTVRLVLNRETIRVVRQTELVGVQGGVNEDTKDPLNGCIVEVAVARR